MHAKSTGDWFHETLPSGLRAYLIVLFFACFIGWVCWEFIPICLILKTNWPLVTFALQILATSSSSGTWCILCITEHRYIELFLNSTADTRSSGGFSGPMGGGGGSFSGSSSMGSGMGGFGNGAGSYNGGGGEYEGEQGFTHLGHIVFLSWKWFFFLKD